MTSAETNNRHIEYTEKRRVTIIGAIVNVLLAALKIGFGIVGHSAALIADGLHSLSDLASDAMVLIAVKMNRKAANELYPYGHARFETVATIGLGLLLLAVAVGITVDAVTRLLDPESLIVPGAVALGVAAVSILAKEWLYHYTVAIARRVRSDLLRANAWHHRTDAISSIIVFVGIAGAMAGLPWLDAVAAIGVSLMIGRIAWELSRDAVRELVDSGVDPETLDEIKKTIESVDGVKEFHMLRTRRMGADVLVEVHVLVDPQVTVSEGHMTGDRVLAQLKRDHPDIGDVLIHIDPEDDTHVANHALLPDRTEMMRALEAEWTHVEAAQQIEKVNLHYLDGKIDVEVILPMGIAATLPESAAIAARISEAAERQEHVGKASVLFDWRGSNLPPSEAATRH